LIGLRGTKTFWDRVAGLLGTHHLGGYIRGANRLPTRHWYEKGVIQRPSGKHVWLTTSRRVSTRRQPLADAALTKTMNAPSCRFSCWQHYPRPGPGNVNDPRSPGSVIISSGSPSGPPSERSGSVVRLMWTKPEPTWW